MGVGVCCRQGTADAGTYPFGWLGGALVTGFCPVTPRLSHCQQHFKCGGNSSLHAADGAAQATLVC
jgi:hypothetical protein